MPKIRTLFCLVDIKKRSLLTSCVFWFVFLNASSHLCFRFVFSSAAAETESSPKHDDQVQTCLKSTIYFILEIIVLNSLLHMAVKMILVTIFSLSACRADLLRVVNDLLCIVNGRTVVLLTLMALVLSLTTTCCCSGYRLRIVLGVALQLFW